MRSKKSEAHLGLSKLLLPGVYGAYKFGEHKQDFPLSHFEGRDLLLFTPSALNDWVILLQTLHVLGYLFDVQDHLIDVKFALQMRTKRWMKLYGLDRLKDYILKSKKLTVLTEL